MTKKIVVRTGDVAGFFDRARDAAQRAAKGSTFDGKVTLSFEDPQKMFTVLSESRRKLTMASNVHPFQGLLTLALRSER